MKASAWIDKSNHLPIDWMACWVVEQQTKGSHRQQTTTSIGHVTIWHLPFSLLLLLPLPLFILSSPSFYHISITELCAAKFSSTLLILRFISFVFTCLNWLGLCATPSRSLFNTSHCYSFEYNTRQILFLFSVFSLQPSHSPSEWIYALKIITCLHYIHEFSNLNPVSFWFVLHSFRIRSHSSSQEAALVSGNELVVTRLQPLSFIPLFCSLFLRLLFLLSNSNSSDFD